MAALHLRIVMVMLRLVLWVVRLASLMVVIRGRLNIVRGIVLRLVAIGLLGRSRPRVMMWDLRPVMRPSTCGEYMLFSVYMFGMPAVRCLLMMMKLCLLMVILLVLVLRWLLPGAWLAVSSSRLVLMVLALLLVLVARIWMLVLAVLMCAVWRFRCRLAHVVVVRAQWWETLLLLACSRCRDCVSMAMWALKVVKTRVNLVVMKLLLMTIRSVGRVLRCTIALDARMWVVIVGLLKLLTGGCAGCEFVVTMIRLVANLLLLMCRWWALANWVALWHKAMPLDLVCYCLLLLSTGLTWLKTWLWMVV